MVKRAVEMEGTVTGEHGVGLIKRDYLEHELGKNAVDAMRKVSPVSRSIHAPMLIRYNFDSSSRHSIQCVFSIATRSLESNLHRRAKFSRGRYDFRNSHLAVDKQR
jgi:FAD linked oxidases, C-terminal domain